MVLIHNALVYLSESLAKEQTEYEKILILSYILFALSAKKKVLNKIIPGDEKYRKK